MRGESEGRDKETREKKKEKEQRACFHDSPRTRRMMLRITIMSTTIMKANTSSPRITKPIIAPIISPSPGSAFTSSSGDGEGEGEDDDEEGGKGVGVGFGGIIR